MIPFQKQIRFYYLTILIFSYISYAQLSEKREIEYFDGDSKTKLDSIISIDFPFMKMHQANDIVLRNRINNEYFLKDYINYENNNDSIIIEKLLYAYRKDNYRVVVANLSSRNSLILSCLDSNSYLKILSCEEQPYIYSLRKEIVLNKWFLLLKTRYATFCEATEAYILYYMATTHKQGFYHAYEDISKKEYYPESDTLLCLKGGESYTQKFQLLPRSNKIILEAVKEVENKGVVSRKRYMLKRHKFE